MVGQLPGSAIGPEVEFRTQPKYRKRALTRFSTWAVLTVAAGAAAAGGLGAGRVAAIVAGAMTVGYGAAYFWQRRFATRVTGRGIDVHGYFHHFIPWQDVRGIEVGGYGPANATLGESFASSGGQPAEHAGELSMLGRGVPATSGTGSSRRMARLATITVVRADGRKVLLRAPLVTGWASDPYFGDKARQLQALCRQYAGPGFESRLPAS